jgi:hypothetical protein
MLAGDRLPLVHDDDALDRGAAMRSWLRERGTMLRIGLIVVAIAAAAFALNLLLFDAAESTGSAGRLSPRADDTRLRIVTTERPAPASVPGPGATTAPPAGRTTTSDDGTDDRGPGDRSDDRGSNDRGSDDRGSDGVDDDSSGRGSGDDGGRGRGRGRGGEDD